jgi:hypothetical protein
MHHATSHAHIQVTVLRGSCADDETCPKITDAGDPDAFHLVAVPETDPQLLAQHARHIAAREVLVRFPRHYLTDVELNPARPRIVDLGHSDALHLVATPETDDALLQAHASHIGAGEVLVRFPRRDLPEVRA